MFYPKVWGILFLGDLTGFSPATCRVHRAARSCLRDCSSVARRRALAPELPASARSPCSTAPGSLSLGLGFRTWGLYFGFRA